MLARKLRLDAIAKSLANKRVLMRVDFNVPVKEGKVKDITRIAATLPTLNLALANNPKSLVLMSHLGRPNGQVVEKHSMRPVVSVLEKQLGRPITFLPDCVGPQVEAACANPAPGTIFLLENLRYHIEEEGSAKTADGKKIKAEKDKVAAFRRSLTTLGDVYVNDAFGTAHRAHSSMVGVNLNQRAAGLLMGKELEYFSKVIEQPKRPLLVIMGGAKVKDKIQLIMNLLDLCNEMIIGGGMAFTFKKTLDNIAIGNSLFDADGAALVPEIMRKAQAKNVQIHLPIDYKCGDKFADDCRTQFAEGPIPDGWMGLDIGPKSITQFSEVIRRAHTTVWNGPVGVFENPHFKDGSLALLNELVTATRAGQISIVGGGDTAAFVGTQPDKAKVLSHISTGGGASLELLEGKELPGVAYLSDA